MNIRDFPTRPVRLVSGHKTCEGCGMPIVIRHVLSATEKSVVTGQGTGCICVTMSTYPHNSWTVPTIHNAFANLASTISGIETAYRVLKRRGRVKKDIKFIAFGGDGGTYDIGLQALSGAIERGHDMVYVCYDNEAYMNCLTRDTLILTERGLCKITEVRKGDKLYSFDPDTYKMVLKECVGVYDNGVKETFDIKTLHQSLKATGNHPFLTVRHNGRGKESELVWKTVEELKPGDEVVVMNGFVKGKSFRFPRMIKVSKKDHKVNILNEVSLPKKSNPDVMKYLGIYLGDGWVRSGRGEVGFSLPKGTKERTELLDLHRKIFGSKYTENENEIHVNSVNLANFIDSLNFGHGARNKRVPDWVFTLPMKEKEAFVEGLLLSDGYQVKGSKSKRYVSASFFLLENLRLLLQTMGYRVGKIHSQQKKKGSNVAGKNLLKDSLFGYICFSKFKRWNIEKYPSQYKYAKFLIGNKYFSTEKIREKKKNGTEPTLDLQVKGSHNFIANGYVVHNTGGQKSSATPYGARTSTTPKGKVLFRKNLTKIIAAHDIPYAAQASIANYPDLTMKAEKAFNIKGPAFLNILSPCVLFWKIDTGMAYHISKLAMDTRFWPLFEVENGNWKLNYKPQKYTPVIKFLKPQGRFKHLLKPENKHMIKEIQKHVDSEWEKLLKICGEK